MIFAIDPGPTQTAWVHADLDLKPLRHGKVGNHELLHILRSEVPGWHVRHVAIEMIASYGMPVGKEVFETCVWIGRFIQVSPAREVGLTRPTRKQIVTHLCGTAKGKDSNVRQALVDRFTPGEPNHGKGTKASPGWFHGFHSDIWAAYAVAVYTRDHI